MIINIIGFNISWFGLVYWGNSFIPIALVLLIAHILFLSIKPNEVLLILVITFIGIGVDSFLQYFNVLIFVDVNHIPFWLMCLWACFAATICHSLRLLESSKLMQVIVGAVFAPLSYIAGYKFGVVDFGYSLFFSYLILSLIWAVLFILFFYLMSRLVKVEVSYA
ncbi:DUF2878 domain-containing protein [Colwelliaceae bacterium BS250]